MHITKFRMTAMPQMFAHINRDRGTISKYSNADIDAEKTPQNCTLLDGTMETLHKRVDEVSHTKRKDLVVCCGVCVTLPEELKHASPFIQRDFFKECHKFLEQKFGPENAVYSVVHFDETTPHLHYGFVPVIEQTRKCRSKAKAGQTYTQERISARDCVNRELLNSLHDELQEHISAYFPNVRIVSEKEHRMKKSKSIAELKAASVCQIEQDTKRAATERENAERAKQEAEAIKQEAEKIGKELRSLADFRYTVAQTNAKKIEQEAKDAAEKIKREAKDAAEKIKREAKAQAEKEVQDRLKKLENENEELKNENKQQKNALSVALEALTDVRAYLSDETSKSLAAVGIVYVKPKSADIQKTNTKSQSQGVSH